MIKSLSKRIVSYLINLEVIDNSEDSSTGVYVGHIGGDARIADNATLRKSGTLTGAYSVTYGGTLYTSTSPVGTPLSSWQRSIGG